jgi:hypothetical protein
MEAKGSWAATQELDACLRILVESEKPLHHHPSICCGRDWRSPLSRQRRQLEVDLSLQPTGHGGWRRWILPSNALEPRRFGLATNAEGRRPRGEREARWAMCARRLAHMSAQIGLRASPTVSNNLSPIYIIGVAQYHLLSVLGELLRQYSNISPSILI